MESQIETGGRVLTLYNSGEALLHTLKTIAGCKHCGSKQHLQFHHFIPGNKAGTIADLVYKQKWHKLIVELRKCIVLCKRCHKAEHKRPIWKRYQKHMSTTYWVRAEGVIYL